MILSISDDLAQEAVYAYNIANGNKAQAARDLGIPASTFKDRLKRAAERGMLGLIEEGPEFVPPGYRVKGTSTYLPDTKQWIKTERDINKLSPEDWVQRIEDVFNNIKTTSKLGLIKNKKVDENLCTVYIIGDHHLGMYSWNKETGETYNIETSVNILLDAFTNLVSRTPPSGYAIILNLGDFFHVDSDDSSTRKSGNPLDVDGRYNNMLEAGVDVLVNVINMVAAKHTVVFVTNLQGNHDRYASMALTQALKAYYRNEGNIHIDTNPSNYSVHIHGYTMMVATHGDMIKPQNMPAFMASEWPDKWGKCKHRYAYAGHIHTKRQGVTELAGETGGATWETFQCLIPKDAWHKASGYNSGRSLTAITHSSTEGEIRRDIYRIKGN